MKGLNDNDLKQTAEKYKKEMLEMFRSKNNDTKDISPAAADINIEPKETTEVQPDNDILEKASKENEENITEDDDIEKRYPPPVIPDFIKAGSKPQERDSFGYLKVRVNTGNGGIPIPGNSVIISEIKDGKEELVKMLMTDTSGETETLKLPTFRNPNGNSPQDYTEASTYNVSVVSEGYFSELSRNVSVFDGVTSVQSFSLIPEPFDFTSDETVVFDNPEPPVS